MNRDNTNSKVVQEANLRINTYEARRTNQEHKFKKTKHIIPISDYYEIRRRSLIITIIQSSPDNPIREVCANANLELIEYRGKRIGRPRNNWWIIGITQLWAYIRRRQPYTNYGNTEFDWHNAAHIATLKQVANSDMDMNSID